MLMEKRSFSKEEKLAIIKEASINGVNSTLEKHGIYPASYYSWKKKYDTMGEEGFSHGMTPQFLKRIRELEKENLALKWKKRSIPTQGKRPYPFTFFMG